MRGNNPIVLDWDGAPPITDPSLTWDPIRQAMGQTRSYANRVNLVAMQPRPDLRSTSYCLADLGTEYLVYAPGAGGVTVSLPAGEYTFEWYAHDGDGPASPTPIAEGPITSAGGDHRFTRPAGASVLYLRSASGPTCGDGVCNGGETCHSCQADCGLCTYSCPGGFRCDGTPVGTGTPAQQVCGGDLNMWACTDAGWQSTGAPCTCGNQAYSCPGGSRCDGTPVGTGTPAQQVCGGDLNMWACTDAGWQSTGAPCTCGNQAYSCPGGSRCDGTPVGTGTPAQQVCGLDLNMWACTDAGWQSTGAPCTCR
jgi:hypothetical protein